MSGKIEFDVKHHADSLRALYEAKSYEAGMRRGLLIGTLSGMLAACILFLAVFEAAF